MEDNKGITQFIGPWIGGYRTTVQFFAATRSVWMIVRDNSGHLLDRSETQMSQALWDFTLNAYRNHSEFLEFNH